MSLRPEPIGEVPPSVIRVTFSTGLTEAVRIISRMMTFVVGADTSNLCNILSLSHKGNGSQPH